jgi:hypothetical protein
MAFVIENCPQCHGEKTCPQCHGAGFVRVHDPAFKKPGKKEHTWIQIRNAAILLAVLVVGAFLLRCLWLGIMVEWNSKPEHTYAFTGYKTSSSGQHALVFETDGMTYLVSCTGGLDRKEFTDEAVASDCKRIKPYLGHILPPTYFSTPDGGVHLVGEIPSLNLSFDVVEGY